MSNLSTFGRRREYEFLSSFLREVIEATDFATDRELLANIALKLANKLKADNDAFNVEMFLDQIYEKQTSNGGSNNDD